MCIIDRYYDSYSKVLEDPNVEAVYIPLPNHLHAEWVMKAADAGKHILCEKPMALNADEAMRIADYCKDRGVILMEGFMYRLNPRTLKIREIIDNGMLGDICTIIAQFRFTINPNDTARLNMTKGAGALMDTGCYCINISRYLMGTEPAAVSASQRFHPGFGCDTSTSAILEFSESRTALISSSFETVYRNSLEVAGTKGTLRVERFFSPPTEGKLEFTVETANKLETFETDAVDQFLVEIDAFADCIRGSRSVPLDPYNDAIPNAMVIDAIRHSAESRRRLEMHKL